MDTLITVLTIASTIVGEIVLMVVGFGCVYGLCWLFIDHMGDLTSLKGDVAYLKRCNTALHEAINQLKRKKKQ